MTKNLKYRTEQRLTFADVDANFNALQHYSGSHIAAALYQTNEVVRSMGGVWICLRNTVSLPYLSPADWSLIGTTPGRVGMELDTPTAGSNLGAGYVVPPYDNSSRWREGAAVNLSTGKATLSWPGLWFVHVSISLEHDESTSARQTVVRLYNVTQSSSVQAITVPVAKNQPATLISTTFAVQITAATIGDEFRIELGGGSTVSSINYESNTFSAVQHTPVTDGTYTLTAASETDAVTRLTVLDGTYVLTAATEADAATALAAVVNPRTYPPVFPIKREANRAVGLTVVNPRVYPLGAASETDSATALTVMDGVYPLGAASEVSVAEPMNVWILGN